MIKSHENKTIYSGLRIWLCPIKRRFSVPGTSIEISYGSPTNGRSWYTSKVAACGTGVAGSILAWVVWFGDWEIGSISSSSKAAAGKTPLHVTTFLNYFKSQRLKR
jgi:hypothetical protein